MFDALYHTLVTPNNSRIISHGRVTLLQNIEKIEQNPLKILASCHTSVLSYFMGYLAQYVAMGVKFHPWQVLKKSQEVLKFQNFGCACPVGPYIYLSY